MSNDKYIIDRRKNPKGKNLSNRQRFIKRTKKAIEKQIKENIVDRSISDKSDEDVNIPIDGISEPTFSHDPSTGNYDFVLPGNKEFVPGDLIPKPLGGPGGPGGSGASDSGEGDDDFAFTLTREEYLSIVFEGLELPNLDDQKGQPDLTVFEQARAGFTTVGNPSNMNLEQSMINSLGRRIALKLPKSRKIKELLKELDDLDAFFDTIPKNKKKRTSQWTRYKEIEEEIRSLRNKARAISFIDPIDLRYNNFSKKPIPITAAVMVCVMDVSASMGTREKELAKRFYLLLYLFLERKYEKVDIVFIRHHTQAKECTEQEFFYDKETGGTMASTGLKLADDIINERYPENEWNIYLTQASDGDNFGNDMHDYRIYLDKLARRCNLYAYVEIDNHYHLSSDLWKTMKAAATTHDNLIAKKVMEQRDIVPIFREIFTAETS
jgi:hypothetical protein